MSEQKKRQRVTVNIYGHKYTVVGNEPPEHVKEVAQLVDHKMKEIKERNRYLDTTRVAVLTAVNIVDDYIKIKKQLERLEQHKREQQDGGKE